MKKFLLTLRWIVIASISIVVILFAAGLINGFLEVKKIRDGRTILGLTLGEKLHQYESPRHDDFTYEALVNNFDTHAIANEFALSPTVLKLEKPFLNANLAIALKSCDDRLHGVALCYSFNDIYSDDPIQSFENSGNICLKITKALETKYQLKLRPLDREPIFAKRFIRSPRSMSVICKPENGCYVSSTNEVIVLPSSSYTVSPSNNFCISIFQINYLEAYQICTSVNSNPPKYRAKEYVIVLFLDTNFDISKEQLKSDIESKRRSVEARAAERAEKEKELRDAVNAL